MIALRKELPTFADFDNRHLLSVGNPNLLVFFRTDPENCRSRVLVINNFNVEPQPLPIEALTPHGFFTHGGMTDLYSGGHVTLEDGQISIPALSFFWLKD
jgi:amylosucrase